MAFRLALIIALSVKDGINIPYLYSALIGFPDFSGKSISSSHKRKRYDAVISQKVTGESTIVNNARHAEALQKAAASLDDVLHGLDTGITSDFVAMDIHRHWPSSAKSPGK